MHPNPAGARIVEANLWRALEPLLASRIDDPASRRLEDGHERRTSADDSPSAEPHDPVGSVSRGPRPVWQRQVDAARPRRRARCADDRRDPHRRRGHHEAERGRAGQAARREDRVRVSVLSPRAVADRVREHPDPDGDRQAARRRRRARSSCSAKSASPIAVITIRRSSRAASSSASRSRARSPTIRRSSWPTSPLEISIRRLGG